MNSRIKINPDDIFLKLLIGDKYRTLRHVALAVTIVALGTSNVYLFLEGGWVVLLNVLVFIPLPIMLNVYVLVPKLLLRNRPWLYLASVTSLVIPCLVIGTVLSIAYQPLNTTLEEFSPVMGQFDMLSMLSTLLLFVLILAGTTSLIIMQLWLRDRIRIGELEEASNMAELDMLKNQINPHFLFNMLNNAIVLTKENSSQAGEVILKLREMLNYQFEMSNVDRIPLRGDIEFLDGLLHLESLRRDRFDYQILTLGDIRNVEVPPLLFIPFVENAIKHGNDNTRESYILLIFSVQGEKLDFFCTNSIPDHIEERETGGLGLKNIGRRLELIYGKDHNLTVNGTSLTYNVNLTIRL